MNEQFMVDVIGFNPVERSMLASIFALAARRDPGFAQYEKSAGGSPDLYLVDIDNPEAAREFQALSKLASLPAVLIGTAQAAATQTVLARPVQWARLLQALEATALAAEPGGVAADVREDATLPLGRSHAGALAGRSSTAEPSIPDQAAKRRALGDKVLVVDDNATVRLFMKAKLAPFGFEVDYAETGEEAVGLTGTREYACVFLDVVLPGIDGYQVCKLIKSNKQAIKKTAVVMLTSRSSPFDKLRGSLAGCDEYLTKPLDEDRLLETIAQFIPSTRKRDKTKPATGEKK
ncbi:MAG: response regulator [Ramlibacter sp.]|jgi:two-component system cell cycle response regulator|nr:response regulator [Ramlibacter sp.]